MSEGHIPYIYLGRLLLKIRERMQESVAEVSGAVEIDNDMLKSYEAGSVRPSEDILELLISHFSVKDEEAAKLWKLAGYEDITEEADSDDLATAPQPVIILPMDARVMYTDSMNVVVNNDGVVINFLQNGGQNGQPVPAARVGMSIEHAKKVVKTLEETIAQAAKTKEQKNLPAPKNDKKKDDK